MAVLPNCYCNPARRFLTVILIQQAIKPMTYVPSVSIVIPTLNGGTFFTECLRAVIEQDYAGTFDVLVIDSCSTDGTAAFARQQSPKGVRIIEILRENFNHGLTRNMGVENTDGELIAFLTQDATPLGKKWLSNLVACFKDDSVAGAYSQQCPRGGAHPLVAARLARWAAGSDTRHIQEIDDTSAFAKLEPLEQVSTVAFDNVASCIRRTVWQEHPFPETSFGEDTQWSYQVLNAGHKIIYEPNSQVLHSHNPTLWYEFRRVYLDHQNWKRLIDLTLFPRWPEIFPATINGARAEAKALGRTELTGLRLLYWQLYALPFIFVQNAAQFWGALSVKWLTTKPWFTRVDKFLRRGI